MFAQMVELQLQLFFLMFVGFLLQKLGVIAAEARQTLSNLLINVVIPCNIVCSFVEDPDIFSVQLLQNCLIALLISAAIQIIATLGSRLLFLGFPQEQARVMTYGMIVSNSSFIGIPVAESVLGSMGVLYTSIFQIPIRLTMWTAGLSLFTKTEKHTAIRQLITHPCILAVGAGMILMLLPVQLPSFLSGGLQSISRCSTAISMMVIGSILAEVSGTKLLNKAALYFCFWRLIGFTVLAICALQILKVDSLVRSVAVIMTGMPAGSLTAILAEQYDQNAEFAAGLVFWSTLLSMVTIPILSLFL